ncbi:uncharacterized protein LOC128922003 isoform X2 [Zeugodacus cucurbitae]|uniref:uncharacterized protein LOC128922003 isoform X2 n=1 Tax=Zeugodacus cucurbitae TaxID=28588 RepID=UPI0023D948B3|nr:uncharacterized protein LOC128922003 isoform X2 [Zeugodacus cucurbitae]
MASIDDHMAENYGHLIGTDDFPLRIIKRLYLTESKCTKFFLNKLRDCHKEIEEAKLISFSDEYLKELLPLPNLKKLICIDAYNLRGRSLIELDSLTELHIHSSLSFDPKYLLQITYYNPLRTFVMPNYPLMFSNRYAFEMFENLKNVEKLVIEFNPCKSWQLVGTLPKLKKLEIWHFVSDKCDTCLEDHNLYKTCAGQHAMIFFDELRQRNQLEELVLYNSCVSEQHLLRISELTNLKRLIFYRSAPMFYLPLDVFKGLVNLKELHLDGCRLINAKASLELIRCCKKLKVLLLKSVDGETADFLKEANYILSRRQPTPLEPLTVEFADEYELLKVSSLPFYVRNSAFRILSFRSWNGMECGFDLYEL